jgi:hypothetical protein
MTKQVGSGLRHDLGVFEVGAWQDRLQSAEYGVQITEELGNKTVGAWLRRALVCIGGQGEALPLPASVARERQLGQHVVLSLPEAF